MDKRKYILKLGKMYLNGTAVSGQYYIFQIEMLRAKDEIVQQVRSGVARFNRCKANL